MLKCLISPCPYFRSRAWYSVWNSIPTQTLENRCSVTTYDAVQFSDTEKVALGMARLACLTIRRVKPLSRILTVSPRKRARRKDC